MSQPYGHVAAAIQSLTKSGSHSVITFTGPKAVIKVTRRTYGQRKPKPSDPLDLVVTIGKPAWLEKEYAKRAVKEGRKFPFILHRPYPKKRK